jgi:SAM-dependent methyltransferase
MKETVYNANFYEDLKSTSRKAAKFVVPYVTELFSPKSVLDVGCGQAEWLNIFTKCGIEDVCGMDGEYVRIDELLISKDKFLSKNLENPIDLERKFDLVMSLEVAEHLSESAANQFIDTLTKHGDLIMFSAAVPGQIGTFHINEQWQNYWIEKFKAKGYNHYDLIRTKFWDNPHVAWWYRQNTFIFMNSNAENKYKGRFDKFQGVIKPKVHPEFKLFLDGKLSFINKLLSNPIFVIESSFNKLRYKLSEPKL